MPFVRPEYHYFRHNQYDIRGETLWFMMTYSLFVCHYKNLNLMLSKCRNIRIEFNDFKTMTGRLLLMLVCSLQYGVDSLVTSESEGL